MKWKRRKRSFTKDFLERENMMKGWDRMRQMSEMKKEDADEERGKEGEV